MTLLTSVVSWHLWVSRKEAIWFSRSPEVSSLVSFTLHWLTSSPLTSTSMLRKSRILHNRARFYKHIFFLFIHGSHIAVCITLSDFYYATGILKLTIFVFNRNSFELRNQTMCDRKLIHEGMTHRDNSNPNFSHSTSRFSDFRK